MRSHPRLCGKTPAKRHIAGRLRRPAAPHKVLLRRSCGLNVCNSEHSVGIAEANQLRRPTGLEILHDLLRELGVPALGADELTSKIAHTGQCLARILVERDVVAEEERVTGLAEDRLLGRLERALAGGGDDLHEPAVCLGALGGHLYSTVAVVRAGVMQVGRKLASDPEC